MGVNKNIDEVQKLEVALEHIEAWNINNLIHAAKKARFGEAHTRVAQSYMATAKGEVEIHQGKQLQQ